MKKAPDIASRNPASPSNALFLHAWTRIWDGDPGRGVRFWETFFWSVLAVFAGFTIFGWVDPLIVRATAWITYAILILLTPLAIGTWVYRVHTSVGSADESLRALPLKPREILLPRMRAVLFTWAKIFVPVMLIFVITGLIQFIKGIPYSESITAEIFYNLFMNIFSFETDYYPPVSNLAIAVINIFGPLYLLGCVTAPIAWGFWLATRFRFSPAGYFLSFMVYYLAFGGIIWASMISFHALPTAGPPIEGNINAYTYFMIGMSFPIITLLCYYTTWDILRRRS